MTSKRMYKFKNLFKSKEQIELESRMMFNKQQRDFQKYYKELGTNIKKYEKMAAETALSGNHQNAANCAKFVLKLRKTQVRVQGLLQRFDMMYSMQRLSGVMSNFMATCAEMGYNMDANINLNEMWKNSAMMEQSLSKLDAMIEQMDMVFDTIDNGLAEANGEMEGEESMDAEAEELLNEIMGRQMAVSTGPAAAKPQQTETNQPDAEAAPADDTNERLRKMMQELKG